MATTLLNRYLLREVCAPTLVCLVVFTLVLVAGRLVQLADLVIGRGVAPGDVALLLTALLPPLLVIIIPLSFLMGIMLGFGRLSGDNETVALKAGGFGLAAMARPVLLLALLCALLTALVSLWGGPWGKRAFRATLFDITRKQVSVGLQPQIFYKDFKNLVIYANDLDPRSGELAGVFIAEQQEGAPLLIFAEAGRLLSSTEEQSVSLQLSRGVIHRQQGSAYQVIGFDSYEIRPSTGALGAEPRARRTSPKELATAQLWQLAEGDGAAAREARSELHGRLSAPLAPLLFALLALPFSTFSQRSGRGGGFLIGLLIYLGYYLATSLARVLTAEAAFPPLATFWLPHLLAFAGALYLFRHRAEERPLALFAWLERSLTALQRLRVRRADH